MSKLAEQIKAVTTSTRAVVNLPYNIKMSMDSDYPVRPDYSIKVRFTVTFGTEYYIKESEKDAVPYVLEKVKRGVVEEVFGEFRKPLLELRHALYEGNMLLAEQILSEIERQMFHV